MTLALCMLTTATMNVLTAVFCMRTLLRRAGHWRLAAFVMPLGQLAVTFSVLMIATTHGLSIAYLIGICAANAFGCAGTCALAQSLAETHGAAVNKERLRAADESARAAREYEALLAANASKMHELCDVFAVELRALEEAMEKRGGVESQATAEDADALGFNALESALCKLEETTRSRYCANVTANALLALKARACTGASIDFAFTGSVPQQLAIDDLELCSVFSNLLDNAINAAHKTDSDVEPYVHVSCAVKGAYLVVKVVNSCGCGNPAVAPAARHSKDASPTREHGWGLEIVRDICASHDGTFAFEHASATEVAATAIFKVIPTTQF